MKRIVHGRMNAPSSGPAGKPPALIAANIAEIVPYDVDSWRLFVSTVSGGASTFETSPTR